MPNARVSTLKVYESVAAGFDRPQDLWCIKIDFRIVFIGYFNQCFNCGFYGVLEHLNLLKQ